MTQQLLLLFARSLGLQRRRPILELRLCFFVIGQGGAGFRGVGGPVDLEEREVQREGVVRAAHDDEERWWGRVTGSPPSVKDGMRWRSTPGLARMEGCDLEYGPFATHQQKEIIHGVTNAPEVHLEISPRRDVVCGVPPSQSRVWRWNSGESDVL